MSPGLLTRSGSPPGTPGATGLRKGRLARVDFVATPKLISDASLVRRRLRDSKRNCGSEPSAEGRSGDRCRHTERLVRLGPTQQWIPVLPDKATLCSCPRILHSSTRSWQHQFDPL